MIEIKTKPMNVHNPFSGSYEELVCNFEVHYDKKGKVDGCSILSIISEQGDDILEWLKEDKMEYLEENYMEVYNE